MKKTITWLLIVGTMSSCQEIFIPLKGNYHSDYNKVLDKSTDVDLTINSIVEYCFKNNISLKIIDRKSGLIITEPYKLNTASFENPEGTPEDSSAHIIIGRQTIKMLKDYYIEPESTTADIVFKVKEEDNKTTVTILFSNITTYFNGEIGCLKDIKSTGVLERQILAKID